jgi:4-hydroxybenzoate polyprenyltransferase
MIVEQSNPAAYLRTLLVLGRVSNLPTVWSNCLCGWLLAGGSTTERFLLLCLGATFLYLGGMYLNDAFDAQFDQQHRSERPIPSGAISETAVWQWGLAWLALGLLCLGFLGKTTAILALLLSGSIFVYDAIHKIFAFSPLLMAACRFFLILMAASIAYEGVTGLSIWSALALATYILGLSFLAQRESAKAALRYWPCLFLAAPSALALVVNYGEYPRQGFLLSLILVIWMVRCLWFSFWSAQRNIGRSVSGLLAGIVLVDWLAIGGGGWMFGPIFVSLFALALLFQRFIPAT